MKFSRIIFLILIVIQSSCRTSNETQVLIIATSANMQFAMETIAEKFEEKHKIEVQLTTNSSGMLTSQIINGAPFDVFVSANIKYPNQLYQDGLSTAPMIYGQGKIALTFRAGVASGSNWQEILMSSEIKKIAVANPKTAPYGIAAIELLKNAKIFEKVESKLVYGESIGQVNQYILSKTVDAAFTSNSFAAKFEDDFEFYQGELVGYSPINQGAVIINNGSRKAEKASELFIKYLATEECQAILINYGFKIDE